MARGGAASRVHHGKREKLRKQRSNQRGGGGGEIDCVQGLHFFLVEANQILGEWGGRERLGRWDENEESFG